MNVPAVTTAPLHADRDAIETRSRARESARNRPHAGVSPYSGTVSGRVGSGRVGMGRAGSGRARDGHGVGWRSPLVAQAVGITYRQLDYWCRRSAVAPSIVPAVGSGSPRLWSTADVHRLSVIARTVDALESRQACEVVAAVWDHLTDVDEPDAFRCDVPRLLHVFVAGDGLLMCADEVPDYVTVATVIRIGWPDPLARFTSEAELENGADS